SCLSCGLRTSLNILKGSGTLLVVAGPNATIDGEFSDLVSELQNRGIVVLVVALGTPSWIEDNLYELAESTGGKMYKGYDEISSHPLYASWQMEKALVDATNMAAVHLQPVSIIMAEQA